MSDDERLAVTGAPEDPETGEGPTGEVRAPGGQKAGEGIAGGAAASRRGTDEPPASRSERPLRHERIAERAWGRIRVRHPVGADAAAERAAEMLSTVAPVVERYLGCAPVGEIRLDLLEEARVSGANPAVGVVRHAVRGFELRSPRTAGVLSYQFGRIAWYRATGEGAYRGVPPREPDWLLEAALLPLMHVWSPAERWLDYVAEQVDRFAWRKPLGEAELAQHRDLDPRRKALALAQSVLRGQSLVRREPDWVRFVVAVFGADPQLSGDEALERVTGLEPAALRATFASDLDAWCRAAADPALGWEGDVEVLPLGEGTEG